VLYGHAFPINPAEGYFDPISQSIKGTWIGEIAVQLFFAMSGILVAKSYKERGILKYIISRALRIYPALIVCTLVMVFGLGLALTNLSDAEYLKHPQTIRYLSNMLLISPDMEMQLPGVEFSPYKAVNGSLWTLTAEVRCYALLLIVGVLGGLSNKLVTTILAGLLVWAATTQLNLIPIVGEKKMWLPLVSYFLAGVMLYQWADQIPLSWPIFALCVLVLFLLNGTPLFHKAALFAFPYTAICVVYLTPSIGIDRWLGDVSYGVYIYAWPIQQIFANVVGTWNPVQNFLYATPFTLLVAYLSWIAIERPALSLKKPFMACIDLLGVRFGGLLARFRLARKGINELRTTKPASQDVEY
jgi:peptidoglycan/LPS O-acetylase OafA/YrhL